MNIADSDTSENGAVKPSADWYFDFISPFAYLQFKMIDAVRTRLDLAPRPILFAALLDHYAHKGPAEIAEKRDRKSVV